LEDDRVAIDHKGARPAYQRGFDQIEYVHRTLFFIRTVRPDATLASLGGTPRHPAPSRAMSIFAPASRSASFVYSIRTLAIRFIQPSPLPRHEDAVD
jgi:hypothetical protein